MENQNEDGKTQINTGYTRGGLSDPTIKTVIPGADKSLARPGRKQGTSVKSVMGRGMDRFG